MTSPARSLPAFLQGGGAMGERIRAFDWSSHPLGPPAQWPQALQMATSLCLNSNFPTAIYWGADFHVLYNDAWSVIPADRHPAALGQPARELWSDIWPVVGPQFDQVWRTGEGIASYEQMLPMERLGTTHETWWNYSLTALRHADGSIAGIFNQGNEITDVVVARRARQAEIDRLRDLFRQAPAPVALLRGAEHVFEIANDAYVRLVGGRNPIGKRVQEALPEVVSQGFVELLDRVYRTGEPYLGSNIEVKLGREGSDEVGTHIVDFIYQPVRDPHGVVDGIFVLVTDVTERARAENALRISNWQLGEERARLASLVEAEQRARTALRRLSETLEQQVRQRTSQLERTVAAQSETADRLRASFEMSLAYQGYIRGDGTLIEANTTSLEGIGARLNDVVGRPFWDTPWFTRTPGLPGRIREAVQEALRGNAVRDLADVRLPAGVRRFEFSIRPVRNARGEVIGAVPEAVDVSARG